MSVCECICESICKPYYAWWLPSILIVYNTQMRSNCMCTNNIKYNWYTFKWKKSNNQPKNKKHKKKTVNANLNLLCMVCYALLVLCLIRMGIFSVLFVVVVLFYCHHLLLPSTCVIKLWLLLITLQLFVCLFVCRSIFCCVWIFFCTFLLYKTHTNEFIISL